MSFLIGGIWLMVVSVIAEKFGNRLAALLGGLPSTLLIALFFIGLNQGAEFTAKAVIITPIIFIIDAYFILLLAVLAKKGYIKALTLSGLCWLIITAIVVLLKIQSYPLSLILWGIGLTILILNVNKIMPTKPVKLVSVNFNFQQLLVRSIFAGAVIALAVIISKYSGSLLGGIFAAFPAVYISSFTILYFARGLNFSQAFAKPLMISGTINVVIYGFAVYIFYPKFGIYIGTLLAFGVSILSSFYGVRYLLIYMTNKKLL